MLEIITRIDKHGQCARETVRKAVREFGAPDAARQSQHGETIQKHLPTDTFASLSELVASSPNATHANYVG
jgi:hypothetical protein